jgi:hypothetical protein
MHRLYVVLVAASTTGALLTGAASPASAQPVPMSQDLFSGSKTVHTSTGKSLHFSVSAHKDTTSDATSSASMGVTLTTGTPYLSGETHIWSFGLTRSSFGYDTATGKGTLNTGTQITPFGTMKLTFTKSKSSTRKCTQSGSTTTVRGKLQGKVNFDSKSGWGTVSNKTFSFSAPNVLTITNGCNETIFNGLFPCFHGTGWDAPAIDSTTNASGFTIFTGNNPRSVISVTRSVLLSHPTGGARHDELIAPAPAAAISGNTLTVKVKSGSPVTGTGKVVGPKTSTSTFKCSSGGHKKTQKTVFHSNAHWSSKAGKPLKFNFGITPDVAVPTSGTGSWSISTFS